MNAIFQRNSNIRHASLSKRSDSIDIGRRSSMANSIRRSMCVRYDNFKRYKTKYN